MALPSRYVSQAAPRSRSMYDYSTPDNRIDEANRAAYEGAMAEQARSQGLEERDWQRRMLTEDRGYGMERERMGLDRERFGLEGELAMGRLGMQGGLANALAEAMGNRQSYFGDMPMRGQNRRSGSQRGYGMNLGDETRNYLMRFLKG